MGGATDALTMRTLDDRAAIAAAAAGEPGTGGAWPRRGIATRSPPRVAQSAAVPGSFTNVPFMQSATALSDGGCADAGVTTFCGAGGMGAEAGTRSRAAGIGLAVCGAACALGATRGGGGGAPCAAARTGLSESSATAAATPMEVVFGVMDSP
jgi:hypothetical protein